MQLGILQTLPELVELTHQYSEPGTYKLSVSVNSLVGPSTSVQQSVIIGEAPCVFDSLQMLGAGESSDQCPEIQQEYEYSLYTSLKINCQAFMFHFIQDTRFTCTVRLIAKVCISFHMALSFRM